MAKKTSLVASLEYQHNKESWNRAKGESDRALKEWHASIQMRSPNERGLPGPGGPTGNFADMRRRQIERAGFTPIGMTPSGLERIGPGGGFKQSPGGTRIHADATGQWNHLMHSTAAATKKLTDQERKLGEQRRGMGQGMLQLGHAMQDAQYGMRAVINNVPGIMQGLGFSAGVAGAGIMAAVGIDLALSQRDKFRKEWTPDETDEERATRMKEVQADREQADKRKSNVLMEAAEKKAEDLEKLTKKEGEVRERAERKFQSDEKLKQIEEEVAQAKLEDLEGSEKLAAEIALKTQQAAEASKRRTQHLEELQSANAAEMKKTEDTLAGVYKELEELKGKRKKEVIVGTDKQGFTDVHGDADTEMRIKAKEVEKKALEAREKVLQDRHRATSEETEEIKKTVGIGAAITAVVDAIKLAQLKAKEKLERDVKEGEYMQARHERFEEFSEEQKEVKKEALEAAKALKERREDAKIAHMRARGRGGSADRLERDIMEKRRVEELQKEFPNMSAEEAKKMARQETRDAGRGKSIRGAGPARQFEGLDAFKQGGMSAPSFPALEKAKEDAKRPMGEKTPTPGEKTNLATFVGTLTQGLDKVVKAIEKLGEDTGHLPADKAEGKGDKKKK